MASMHLMPFHGLGLELTFSARTMADPRTKYPRIASTGSATLTVDADSVASGLCSTLSAMRPWYPASSVPAPCQPWSASFSSNPVRK